MLSEQDLAQIEGHGIDSQSVYNQLHYFAQGFPFLTISRAAVVGDGIIRLTPEQENGLRNAYQEEKQGCRIVKFVPASGAATRMFKSLFEYLEQAKPSAMVDEVVRNIERFAFARPLQELLGTRTDPKAIAAAIISPEGLGYGEQPKALILFHHDGETGESRTALEEHLSEGAQYAAEAGGTVRIHFTVSPEHQSCFERLIARVLPQYETKYKVQFSVTYSQQKPATDTLAVTPDNQPFRDADGTLLFRPAGHGALLSNLNDLDADLLYVKTIDNVVPDRHKKDTILYKEVIGGLMLSRQARCFDYLRRLEAASGAPSEALVEEVAQFFESDLCGKLPADFAGRSATERAAQLTARLNRPIRVCGMVRNAGEPGGGPFWVSEADGSESLQIAESSQIAPEQQPLMAQATHFNPVDLVCGIKDYRGHKFDLNAFTDPNTGFISMKSKNGQQLKAQELPGLWNGAMAHWNTIFVEVPITTFCPVKEIVDLLRPQHQTS